MLSERVTVVIPTKNEQARLPLVIENFAGRFALMVSDNHSTDGTLEIAHKACIPAITLDHPGYYENDQVMPILWSAVHTDYMIIAGCAEFFPPALLQRLAEIANSGSHDVVYIKRYSMSYGQLIPLSASPEVYQRGELRMYRRGAVDFSETVIHGSGGRATVAPERQCTLGQDMQTAIIQFRDYDSSHNELQNNRYNNLWAEQRFNRGERFGLIGTGIDCAIGFGSCYIRHGAWRHGVGGLIIALQRGIMTYQVHSRLWEMEHGVLKAEVGKVHATLRREALDAASSSASSSASAGMGRLADMRKRLQEDSLLDYRGWCAIALTLVALPWMDASSGALAHAVPVVIVLALALAGYRRLGTRLHIPWSAGIGFGLAMIAGNLGGREVSLVTCFVALMTLAALMWLGPLLQTPPARIALAVLLSVVGAFLTLISLSILPTSAQATTAYATVISALLAGVVVRLLASSVQTRELRLRLALAMLGIVLSEMSIFRMVPMAVFEFNALVIVGVALFGALLRWDAIAIGALAGMIMIVSFPGPWMGAIPLCGVLALLLPNVSRKC